MSRICSGIGLVELMVSVGVMSVGSLAVFTVFFHLHQAGLTLESDYQRLDEALAEGVQVPYLYRIEPYPCESQPSPASWRDN